MGGNSTVKIVYFLLFIALAAVSCWATSSSLHLLWPGFPVFFCWLVTIAFFLLSSWGTKMVVESFGINYVEHRYVKLFGGILLILFFWLLFSMPTNTHTFFYNLEIGKVYNNDVTRTNKYLNQISQNEGMERMFQNKCDKLRSEVNTKLGEFQSEIMNDANPGFGPNAKRILKEFAQLFQVPKIEPLSYKGTTIQDRSRLCDAYRSKMYTLLDQKISDMRSGIQAPTAEARKNAEITSKNLNLSTKYIRGKKLSLKKEEDVVEVNDQLTTGYNLIKNNRSFIFWDSENEEKHYTQENTVTDVMRLISVFDVWKDFLAGKYKGSPFIYWIIFSVLVDLGAFLFFVLAFKRNN